MFEVIPHRFWRRDDGRTASPYGALPYWHTDTAEKARWTLVTDGYTTSNPDGTIGLSCIRDRSFEAVSALVAKLNAERNAARIAHEKAWAPVNAPIEWRKQIGNDGLTRHYAEHGMSIVKDGAAYVCVDHGDDEDMPAYRSLAKAKAWCEQVIRSRRKAEAFAA